jgi:PPP family 3-phenylpropionic acid transporter
MLLTLSLALVITTRTILPLAEAIAVFEVRRQKRDYGRVRLWGSISFTVASMAAGLAVQWRGEGSIIPLLALAGVLTAISAHCVPPAKNGESRTPTRTPLHAISEVIRAVTSQRVLVFLFTAACVQGSHAMFYTFGMVHWSALGLSPVVSSAIWNVGLASEILVLWQSRVLLSRFGAAKLLTTAAAAGAVRWSAMGLEPPVLLLPVLQLLHGLTYGATHAAAMQLISEMVAPRLAGTMQAIYTNATSGIALGFATVLAGYFYPTLKGSAYFSMAALALLGVVAGICLIRIESTASTAHHLTIVSGRPTHD